MRQNAKEIRAAEIEDAAYQVLESKGYGGMSMLAVAKKARASNETLYRWYGDKTGLFEALILRNAAQVLRTIEAFDTPPSRHSLPLVGVALLEMLLGDRAVALNRAAAADGSGTLGATLRRAGRDSVLPAISELIAQLVAQGQLGAGNLAEQCETWLGLLIGDLQLRRVTGALPSLEPDTLTQRSNRAFAQLQQLYPLPQH